MGGLTKCGCPSHKWSLSQELGVCHTSGVGIVPAQELGIVPGVGLCHTYWVIIKGCYIVKVTLHVDVTGHSTRRRTAHLVQETKVEKETKQEEAVELW